MNVSAHGPILQCDERERERSGQRDGAYKK